MHVLLALSIVAVAPDAPIDARYPAAEQCFHCAFDRTWDKNYDDWPDGWRRRRGSGFPHYVKIAIRQEPSPVGDRSLRIDLDGGGAVVYSPLVPVSPLFSYVLEARLETQGLNRYTLTLASNEDIASQSHQGQRNDKDQYCRRPESLFIFQPFPIHGRRQSK